MMSFVRYLQALGSSHTRVILIEMTVQVTYMQALFGGNWFGKFSYSITIFQFYI